MFQHCFMFWWAKGNFQRCTIKTTLVCSIRLYYVLENSKPSVLWKWRKMLWTHFSLKMHQCQSGYDAARLDHMQRGKSANPALFSLLLTPDLLLENTVSSGAPSLMMCNHSGCLHGAFNVGRDQQAPLISRDIFVSMHVQRWLRLLEDLPLCLLTSKVPSCQGFLYEGLMQYRT